MKAKTRKRWTKYLLVIPLFVVLSGALYMADWYQVLGNKITTTTLPDDLKQLTVTGQIDLDGVIYFEATHNGTDGRPFTIGNYLLELHTKDNSIVSIRMPSNGLSYERHNNELLSFYEIKPHIVEGQKTAEEWAGIPTQNGGDYILMNPDRQRIATISNNQGLDLHELTITPDGNYIYMITDQQKLYKDPTITCLWQCQMFGQSIIEVTPDGKQLYRYDLLDYYSRDDFVMDDVFHVGNVKLYDLTHANSVYLHNDTLIVSVRHANEIIAIDRANGDLLWRTSEMNFTNDDGFSHQHDANITDDGTLLLFDNANGKERKVSRAVEYRIDGNDLVKIWEYENGHFQPNRGSARRLPDGSTLINFVTHIELVKDDTPVLTIALGDYYTSYQADYWQN